MHNLDHIEGATDGMSRLFDDVKEKLLNSGVINHVDMYNSQEILIMDEEENLEFPFPTPAAFIAFRELNWDTFVDNVQWVNGIMQIRLVDFHLVHYPKAILDLKSIVQALLHGMKPEDDVYTSLMRSTGEQDVKFNGLITFNLFYEFTALADEAHKPDVEKLISNYTLNKSYK